MILVIAAQDITSITFGLADEGEVRKEETIQASPEEYVSAFDQVLTQWSVARADIESILVVTGPGSFTASRVSTTIANGLGFAWNIPVVGTENPAHVPISDLDLAVHETFLHYARPTYDRPPEITTPKEMRGDNARDEFPEKMLQ